MDPWILFVLSPTESWATMVLWRKWTKIKTRLRTAYGECNWTRHKYLKIHLDSFLGYILVFHPHTISQSLDSSKLKEFADDNFEYDENGGKSSKKVKKKKNSVEKWEIAGYEQILTFPTVFSKDLNCTQVIT